MGFVHLPLCHPVSTLRPRLGHTLLSLFKATGTESGALYIPTRLIWSNLDCPLFCLLSLLGSYRVSLFPSVEWEIVLVPVGSLGLPRSKSRHMILECLGFGKRKLGYDSQFHDPCYFRSFFF